MFFALTCGPCFLRDADLDFHLMRTYFGSSGHIKHLAVTSFHTCSFRSEAMYSRRALAVLHRMDASKFFINDFDLAVTIGMVQQISRKKNVEDLEKEIYLKNIAQEVKKT